MVRVGVFIGVDKTGDLQKLNDAAAGAKAMHEWAMAQGMPDKTHAKLITDASGKKVTPDEISDAVHEICNGAGADQLVVYFAGHGINLHGDRWLLTEAPDKPYAAVNVIGSVELARTCGIPHVVIIADACRVAPQGMKNQNVTGIEIFPNTTGGDRSKPVDQFFACYLGRAAAEIRDGATAPSEAATYSALYTDALLDALLGTRPEVLAPGEAGDASLYVKPWALEDYLEAEIPRRVKALKLEKKVNQNPDAIITSRDAWLARHVTRVGASRGNAPAGAPPAPAAPPPPTLRSISRGFTASASAGDRAQLDKDIEKAVADGVTGAAQFAGAMRQIAEPFGPEHFETKCGIKVRGGRIASLFAPSVTGSILDGAGTLLRVDSIDGPAASALLEFDDGSVSVIPVLQGFLAALTLDQGELVDVAYEPSDNTWRWDLYKQRVADVRALRALAATASRHGRFHLNAEDAERVGRQMQYAKGIDPTLAVYAAYAYHDVQMVDRIRDMSGYLQSDVGVTFFDLELLGRRLVEKTIDRRLPVVPFVPLLAQGWSLLGAHRVRLHPTLDSIQASLKDSLWTQFERTGVEKLRQALASKEVR